MLHKIKHLSLIFLLLLIIASCSTSIKPIESEVKAESLPNCHIVFDAGSSGTRLYVYEKQGNKWLEHPGPKLASALADPIREIRGKKITDIDAVTGEVVSALDKIKQDGPFDEKKGKVKWSAFDWSKQCSVVSAVVYATAGMRIAEQQNPNKSLELWANLNQKLKAKVGGSAKINTRTLTGYEEGLYAWLTVRETKDNNDFGTVEMGGASTQITFPCPKCDVSDDANKSVMVKGEQMQIYSYSFLGLGQDEAPKTLVIHEDCTYGIGIRKKDWKKSDCSKQIQLTDTQGIYDPYNFEKEQQGTHRKIPSDKVNISNWFLMDKFVDWKDSQIGECCKQKGQCFDKISSCFRPIYFEKYLQTLNIPRTTEKLDASWTLGSVVCTVGDCLQKATTATCGWLKKGCLKD